MMGTGILKFDAELTEIDSNKSFLDPVGSLVSTLWVVVGCGWVVTLFLKV